ncbi:vacuolar membrane-associated protein iml1 [Naganishia albida]|nr:vacuolar membrane-associated protein iml1 [Naganishia albida]
MVAKSPPLKTTKSAAEMHTSNVSQSRAPIPSIQPPTPTIPSAAGEPEPKARKPEKTTVVMNIHMAAAFDREPVVTDLREIPWAKQGDIIAVRPVERREWEPNPSVGGQGGAATAAAATAAGEELGAEERAGNQRRDSGVDGGKRTAIRGERHRRGPKGHFLFRLGGNDDAKLKKLQQPLSLSDSVAEVFGLANRMQVDLIKVDPKEVEADFIELTFTGQYLGRSDMWRLGMALEGRCVHVWEKVEFAGIVKAEVKGIYVRGKRRASALVTPRTKTIFRSKSAQAYIFIQLCREMFEFDEDGERYYEKALYGFMPELFQRWKDAKVNHVVTIVLFARVYYDAQEVEYLNQLGITGREALLHTPHAGYYKDFYRVIVDFETRSEWATILPVLKQQLLETHEQILLNHHRGGDAEDEAKIIGRLSFAYEGNVLESINLVLNPFDEHHIDRDLSRTGLSIMVVTPGVGYFNVDKTMLRLTTERLLDAGFTIDMICMSQIPLHVTPLFSYWSRPLPPPKKEEDRDTAQGEIMAELSADSRGRFSSTRMHDLLYWDVPEDGTAEQLIFSVSPLLYCHFYSKSHDRPFKEDRFIPRCKMYEIQMLGLIDHDLTTLALPTLDEDEMAAKAVTDAQNLEDEHDAFDESLFVSAFAQPVEPRAKKLPTTPIPEGTIDEAIETPKLQKSPATPQLQKSPGASAQATPLQNSPEALSKASPIPAPSFEVANVKNEIETQHESTRDGSNGQGEAKTKTPDSSRPVSIAPRSRAATVTVAEVTRSPRAPDFGKLGAKTTSRATPLSELDQEPAGATFSAPGTPPNHSLKGKQSKSSLVGIAGASKFFNYIMGRTAIVPAQPSEAIVTKETVSFDKLDRSASTRLSKAGPPNKLGESSRPPPIRLDSPESVKPTTRDAVENPNSRSRTDSLSKVEPMAIPMDRTRNSDIKRVKRPPKKPTYRQKEDEDRSEPPSKATQPLNRSHSEQDVVSRSWQSAQASSWKHREAVRKGEYWRINPCQPRDNNVSKNGRHRRWQFSVPRPTFTQDVKWDSIIAPCCLPLTTDLIPLEEELRTQYREQLYHFACDANQLSFLLRADEVSDLPIAVMREMASQRLSQNFQFLVADPWAKDHVTFGQVKGIRTGGASEVLNSARGPLWLSTPNQVHRLDFALENKNTLEVHNFTRKLFYSTEPYSYNCLMWPRKRKGYQLINAELKYPTRSYDFNYLDRLISGVEDELTDALRYWRTRFLLIPSGQPQPTMTAPTGEPLREEEIHIVGATKLLEMIGKSRWTPYGSKKDTTPPSLLPTWLDPSACVTDPFLMEQLDKLQKGHKSLIKPDSPMEIHNATLESIAAAMRDPEKGLPISDRWWHRVAYPDSFQGDAFVTWLQTMYTDIKTREQAVEWGQRLQKKGLIEHCNGYHGFLDGYYFYRLAGDYAKTAKKRKGLGWFSKGFSDDTAGQAKQPSKHLAVDTSVHSGQAPPSPVNQFGLTPPELEARDKKKKKRKVNMSQTMILDLDPHHKSDRAEVAILHADVIHNPVNAFHFELNWIGVTAGFIDDIRQRWNNVAKKHGLRLVEAPVEQIKDMHNRCAWRAPSPIKLALAPPAIKDLDERLPEKVRTANYFEYAILTKKFDFVLDVEATSRSPDYIEAEYSYRKAGVFDYSQFVHKSGLALVQCIGGEEGFLWSDNRLFFSASTRYHSEMSGRGGTPMHAAASRLSTVNNNSTATLNHLYAGRLSVNTSFPTTIHTASPSGYIPGQPLTKQQQADVIREKLEAFCANPVALAQFYESVTPPLVAPSKEELETDDPLMSPAVERSPLVFSTMTSEEQTVASETEGSNTEDRNAKIGREEVDVSLLLEANGPYGV